MRSDCRTPAVQDGGGGAQGREGAQAGPGRQRQHQVRAGGGQGGGVGGVQDSFFFCYPQ